MTWRPPALVVVATASSESADARDQTFVVTLVARLAPEVQVAVVVVVSLVFLRGSAHAGSALLASLTAYERPAGVVIVTLGTGPSRKPATSSIVAVVVGSSGGAMALGSGGGGAEQRHSGGPLVRGPLHVTGPRHGASEHGVPAGKGVIPSVAGCSGARSAPPSPPGRRSIRRRRHRSPPGATLAGVRRTGGPDYDQVMPPAPGENPRLGISRFVYGTTRLGDAQLPRADRVRMARAAMEAGVWFHTSHTYGDALAVLREAFDADRARVPKLVYKIGWSSMAELRDQVRLQLDALGLDHMDMGQLCLGGPLADELWRGGPCRGELRRLREEGLVRSLVLEVFPWTSAGPLDALRHGHLDGVVDGFIFYLNPLQRFASNALWDELLARGTPILALRTVGGGDVHRLRDVPGAAWKPYLQERAAEVAPLFERSGCASWPEFCARYALGFPQVQATIGATIRPEHLRALLAAVQGATRPLPADLRDELLALQRRWSDETDVHAEPWSM